MQKKPAGPLATQGQRFEVSNLNVFIYSLKKLLRKERSEPVFNMKPASTSRPSHSTEDLDQHTQLDKLQGKSYTGSTS